MIRTQIETIKQEDKRMDMEDGRRGEEIEVSKEANQIARIQANKPTNGSSTSKA
ncbi:MAG: hypothetical protein GTO54_00990 [Nitrososphaeria archaeon]|nr:hypothetical protein [Nitrososphaeria archaeon]